MAFWVSILVQMEVPREVGVRGNSQIAVDRFNPSSDGSTSGSGQYINGIELVNKFQS